MRVKEKAAMLTFEELNRTNSTVLEVDGKTKVAPPLEYVGAAWLAEHIGTTQQNVTKTAMAMLNPAYRGKEQRFTRPDAVIKGRTGNLTPLWLASRFEVDEK